MLFAFAQLRVRQLRNGARLDHADFERLRERLLRPDVETRAHGEESDLPTTGGAAAALPEGFFDGRRPLTVLHWSGVDLEGSELARHLRDQLGIEAERILPVGGLDRADDEEALGVLRGSDDPVALVPPCPRPITVIIVIVASLCCLRVRAT